jgi:hypothetical protein
VTRFLEPTRERFLMAIAAALPPERFIELHFFAPIRQGGVESGVAVIAAHPEVVAEPILADAPPVEEPESNDLPHVEQLSALEELPDPDDLSGIDDVPAEEASSPPRRYTVYAAKYRLVLKGPDRGKWDSSLVAEADAPLVTVETVVRGVQRRSGDSEDPERMSGDEAREFVLAAAGGFVRGAR